MKHRLPHCAIWRSSHHVIIGKVGIIDSLSRNVGDTLVDEGFRPNSIRTVVPLPVEMGVVGVEQTDRTR